jgi:hypothetical protein
MEEIDEPLESIEDTVREGKSPVDALIKTGYLVESNGTKIDAWYGFAPDWLRTAAGYPGASRSPMAATATRSRAMAARCGSTVIKASACSRVTARYSASLSVSQSC